MLLQSVARLGILVDSTEVYWWIQPRYIQDLVNSGGSQYKRDKGGVATPKP